MAARLPVYRIVSSLFDQTDAEMEEEMKRSRVMVHWFVTRLLVYRIVYSLFDQAGAGMETDGNESEACQMIGFVIWTY